MGDLQRGMGQTFRYPSSCPLNYLCLPEVNPNHQASPSEAVAEIWCPPGTRSKEEKVGSGWKKRRLISTR